jgi:hypothetical protein
MVREKNHGPDEPVFYAYNIDDILIATSSNYLTDITWDTEAVKHPIFEHDDSSATVTLGKRVYGYYEIQAELSTRVATHTNVSATSFWLYDDTDKTYLAGSYGYCLNSDAAGHNTCTIKYIWFVDGEKNLKIQGRRFTGSNTVRTIKNGCRFFIRYLG